MSDKDIMQQIIMNHNDICKEINRLSGCIHVHSGNGSLQTVARSLGKQGLLLVRQAKAIGVNCRVSLADGYIRVLE